jgi:monoamine oxidase
MPLTILGGGIAGLYTALKAIDHGHTQITLYEARERLGGNIFTHYGPDYQLEAGAGRFNQYHKRLLKLLKRFQLTIVPLSNEKWYAPILCPGKRMADPSPKLLETVIEYAQQHYTPQALQQMTFSQLCDEVLGHLKSNILINAFGYDADFKLTNAYQALQDFKDVFNISTPYYICAEGLGELVQRITQYLQEKNVKIYTQWMAQDILLNKDQTFTIKFIGHRPVKTNQLVLALPSTYIKSFSLFTDTHKALLDTVTPISLHRIYAKENKPSSQQRITTDLPLRQYIPIDPAKGIAMVSYSDYTFADYWKTYADQGVKKLNQQLLSQLKQLFPNNPPTKFEWILSFYWKEGVHAWKPSVNPKKIRKEIKNLYTNLYIVGESYSLHQAWIEGALETVDDIFPLPQHQAGGNPLPLEYVKLTLPGESKQRIVDVTKWKNLHPGGPTPYLLNMHQDVTKKFMNNPYHFDPTTKQLKANVLKAIEKYTV